MSKLRVHVIGVSLDGFLAGPSQDREHPLGVGGEALHQWFFATRTFKRVSGQEGGAAGVDDDFAGRGFAGVGASIMGRNMFGPIRGPWPDESWRGWWGETPPFRVPVFVLTHQERVPLQMPGGTTFHFVTRGIHEALARAREAAGSLDVLLGGGAATIRQYLAASLVDELHLAIAPAILGTGEPLFAGLDLPRLGYRVAEHATGASVLHVVLRRA